MLKRRILIVIAILFLIIPFAAGAVFVGERVDFYVDSQYDLFGREEISATLEKITNQLYFYVDKEWWKELDSSERRSLDTQIYNLSVEFEETIYPTLTSTFGSEPKPGIDRDEKITVLTHPMKKEAGGYFNSGDGYPKLLNPKSNEREMVYLNAKEIDNPNAKSFLAHEFLHLITFNQKDLLRGISEETWLNEARAEYAPTLLGYDTEYKGSNLETRVKVFLGEPSNSLTEWLNEKGDYGVVDLFIQYLVDHYGKKILVDSLQSSKVGIPSINEALAKNGFKDDFSQIFANWAIAVLANDCKLGSKYCYLNKNLKDLRLTPTLYYLPRTETILSTYHNTTYWSANWYKFIGGGQNLTSEFEGVGSVEFKIPYLLCDLKGECSVEFLILDEAQKGKITIPGFNAKYSSLTVIPFIKSKTSGFDGKESSYSFYFKVSTSEKAEKEEELIEELLAQIEYLQREIAKVQAQINALLAQKKGTGSISCQKIEKNLYYGLQKDTQVRCLQEFLKSQGSEIYPEGLVTGNFLALTRTAVIRFQKKYASEILAPWGLTEGTGFVGETTRAKINEVLGQ